MLFNVGELIVSKYVAESINNWLQDVSATRAFVSWIQNVLYTADKGPRGWNVLQSVVNWFCYVFAHNQFTYTRVGVCACVCACMCTCMHVLYTIMHVCICVSPMPHTPVWHTVTFTTSFLFFLSELNSSLESHWTENSKVTTPTTPPPKWWGHLYAHYKSDISKLWRVLLQNLSKQARRDGVRMYICARIQYCVYTM